MLRISVSTAVRVILESMCQINMSGLVFLYLQCQLLACIASYAFFVIVAVDLSYIKDMLMWFPLCSTP